MRRTRSVTKLHRPLTNLQRRPATILSHASRSTAGCCRTTGSRRRAVLSRQMPSIITPMISGPDAATSHGTSPARSSSSSSTAKRPATSWPHMLGRAAIAQLRGVCPSTWRRIRRTGRRTPHWRRKHSGTQRTGARSWRFVSVIAVHSPDDCAVDVDRDDGHGGRADLEPMHEIQRDAEEVHQRGADHVAVRYDGDITLRIFRGDADQFGGRPALHVEHQLAAGRGGQAANAVETLPLRIGIEVAKRPAGPVAEFELAETG